MLFAVGSIPTTAGLGLEDAGVRLTASGHIEVDKVSRTSARGVYAAGDVTGVLPLASVAATQGRIAMSHALGDAVKPLRLRGVVGEHLHRRPRSRPSGCPSRSWREQGVQVPVSTLPLARNPRAKMLGVRDGFVKIFAHAAVGHRAGRRARGPARERVDLPADARRHAPPDDRPGRRAR